MITARSLFAVHAALLFLGLLLHHCCYARNINYQCPPSSCGNILNISYPFRLQTDPKNCGHKRYTLSCENNITVVYLDSAKYNVLSINYNNFTIRLMDAHIHKDNCSSIPRHSFNRFFNEYWHIPYEYYREEYYQSLVFLRCQNRILNSPFYVDTSPCINSTDDSGYSYVKINGSTGVMELLDSCRIEYYALASFMPKQVRNISYMDVHNIMALGFELSWFYGCCDYYDDNPCRLDQANRSTSCYKKDMLRDDAEKLFEDLNYITKTGIWHSFEGLSRPERPLYYLFDDAKDLLGQLVIVLGGRSIHYPGYYALGLLPFIVSFLVLYRVAIFVFGSIGVTFFLIYKWRKRHLSMYDNIEEFLQNFDTLLPVRYSYSDIKKITKGFKEKLGEGGYGSVYKGKLRSGHFAAIKILGKSKANGQEFINEVATIGTIYHANVVHLVGFCAEGSKRALIYEFMPNGSLEKYLFSREGSIPISIKNMYEISLGVARGIEYLHEGCNMQILHFDIKPHNILLDEKFLPKISDFGLAKLYSTNNSIVSLTAARGTMGYMAPELFYKNIGRISHKADVYSFGVLLMEMVGRRKSLDAFAEHSSQIYFPTWAYDQCSRGHDIDLGAVSDEEKKIVKKMTITSLWCIQLEPIHRPSMHKVIEMLEGDVESLKMPPKPSLSINDKGKEEVEININSKE